MRHGRGVIAWGLAPGLALLTIGLLFGQIAQTDAQEPARWEALGPEGRAVDRLLTPASGALLPGAQNALLRSELAYDPRRPDEVYALFSHYEPAEQAYREHTYIGATVRMSRDGGTTWWTELGAPDGPSVSELAVGVDGRYLFAATDTGVHRIALSR